jgi:hypothetical protein
LQFACLLGCNNAAGIQQIVRLSCLSRPLQAHPKTSADLRSEVRSSANQPHLLGLNSLVRATGRAVSGNARAPSSLKADIFSVARRVISICAVRPFVRPFRGRAPRGAAYCYSPLLATCKLLASVRPCCCHCRPR